MKRVKIIDGAVAIYPYHLTQLRVDYPDTSFPQPYELADLTAFGIHEVADVSAPTFDPATQAVDDLEPVLVNGVWTQQWAVRAATQAEIDAYAAQQAAAAQTTAGNAARIEAKADAVIQYLVSHAPAEIAAKVGADITNLATAKAYIAKLAIAVSVLARKELR